MKAGFILPSNGNAGGVFVVYIQAQALVQKGWDVTIVFASYNSEIGFGAFPGTALKHCTLDAAIEAKMHFDILFGTWWETVFHLPKLVAGSYLYFVQSDERRFYPETESRSRTLVEFTYRLNSLGIITEARWIQSFLQRDFGSTVEYAPNGVDTRLFNSEGPPLVPKQEKLRVLIEGAGMHPFKRIDDAFAAVKPLRDKANLETWYVSSDGFSKPEWQFDRIFKKVPYKDMPGIYRSCDILVKLSAVEGFFGPPLEMMACGGTVVVSNVTGHEEYIEDGKNALVVPVGDIASATTAIAKLVTDQNLRARLQHNGHHTAQNMDWGNQTGYFEKAAVRLARQKKGLSSYERNLIESLFYFRTQLDYLTERNQELNKVLNFPEHLAASRFRSHLKRFPCAQMLRRFILGWHSSTTAATHNQGQRL